MFAYSINAKCVKQIGYGNSLGSKRSDTTNVSTLYLQYNFLMSRFRPLSQNVLDLIIGYLRQTMITTNEQTPRAITPNMAPASSAAGTEIREVEIV